MQISQGGRAGSHPDVLLRFREIVGEGNITGPYRGYLFYWKTTRKDVIDQIALRLWPYLSEEKRAQFAAMTLAAGRDLPASLHSAPIAARTQLAWAAGLFDGEGSIWASGPRGASWRSPAMEIAQSSSSGIPETLRRFLGAVGVGSICGPHPPRSPWSRLPQYRSAVSGRHRTSVVVRVIWPWLGVVKREQILALRKWLDPDIAELRASDT